MEKILKVATVISLLLLQAFAHAECPAVFDEIEPGFCDRQEVQRVPPQDPDLSHNYLNDSFYERYPHLNFRPNYESVSIDINTTEAALIAGVAASAILVFNHDEELMDFVQDNKNEVTEVAAFYGEKMGSMPAMLGAGGYLLGVVLKNGEIKSTSLMVVKTALVSGFITRIMKMSFSRQRPHEHNGAYEFSGFDLSNDHVSFPSGHTTTAFAFATVIAETYKEKSKWIPVLAYGAAAIGGWSRMHDEAHWGTDVLVGALIGHLTAKKMMSGLEREDSKYDMSFYPVVSSEYVGFHFQFKGRKKKDDSAKKFFERCHKHFEVNPNGEDPVRVCTQMYLNSVWQE